MDQMKTRCKMRRHALAAIILTVCVWAQAEAAHAQTATQRQAGDETAPDEGRDAVLQLRGSTAALTSPVEPAPNAVTPPEDPFLDEPLFQPEALEEAVVAPVDEPPTTIPADEDRQGRERREQPAPPVTDPEGVLEDQTRANVRAQPEQPGQLRVEEADPFEPTGFRLGIWQAFTRLEQTIGYATNNSFSTMGEPGAFSQTDGTVELRSDWSRHEARIIANGSLRRSIGSEGGVARSNSGS